MTRLLGYVDPSDARFVAAVLTIAFNPLFWNVVSALTPTPTAGRLFPPLPRLWWERRLCFPVGVGTQLEDAGRGPPSL